MRGLAMAGRMRLEVRAEPSFMDLVASLGDEAEVVVARSRVNQKIVGLGVRVLRRVWMGGRMARTGHLMFLHGAAVSPWPRSSAAGYGLLGELQQKNPADFHTTAILAENHAARRLLEANVRGLPRYTALCDLITFTLGTRDRRLRRFHAPAARDLLVSIDPHDWASLREALTAHLQPLPCAPVVDADESLIARSAANVDWRDFVAVRERGRILAAAALWDQRQTRQMIVAGYGPTMRFCRPIWNTWQSLRGRPRLPAIGAAINLAYVSHLAVDAGRPDALGGLLELLARKARTKGIDYLVLSLAASHPLCPRAATLAGHQTRSILYSVCWPGDRVPEFGHGPPYVEAGML